MLIWPTKALYSSHEIKSQSSSPFSYLSGYVFIHIFPKHYDFRNEKWTFFMLKFSFLPTVLYKIELSCRKKRVVIIERERERERERLCR